MADPGFSIWGRQLQRDQPIILAKGTNLFFPENCMKLKKKLGACLAFLASANEVCHMYLPCIITSNCRQIWRPYQPMSLIVSGIVGDVNEEDSIVNKCLCR